MHHTLRFYGKYQRQFLHIYMAAASLTTLPVLGRIVRMLANTYGRRVHGGYALTLSEAEKIIDIAENVSLGPCSCRAEFHNCDREIISEIVLGNNSKEVYASRQKEFRQVSKHEAKEILQRAHGQNLTQSIMRCGNHFYAICNCCRCCCVPLRLRQEYGIGQSLIRNPEIIEVFRRHQL